MKRFPFSLQKILSPCPRSLFKGVKNTAKSMSPTVDSSWISVMPLEPIGLGRRRSWGITEWNRPAWLERCEISWHTLSSATSQGHVQFSTDDSLPFHKSYKAFLMILLFSTSLAIFSHSRCHIMLWNCWIDVVLKVPISKVIRWKALPGYFSACLFSFSFPQSN